jgi:hypothetical protein
MKRGLGERVFLSICVLIGMGIAAGVPAFALFNDAGSNPGNTFESSTLILVDNDTGNQVVSLPSASPNDSSTGCITVTYQGNDDANVRMYLSSPGTLAPYLTLTVTRGTDPDPSSPAFPSCGGFTADGTNYIGAGNGVVYSGAVSAYPTTYAGGIVDPPSGGAEVWSANEPHTYQYVISLNNNTAAQGQSSNVVFTWEARLP